MAGCCRRILGRCFVHLTPPPPPPRWLLPQDWDYPDMARIAATRALNDACIDYSEVEQVCVGYCYGDSTCGQRAVYQLGMTGIPVYNVR